ncbi:MAG: DUF4129 domain-containing protein [Anaerolineae bacterium]
MTDDSKRKTLIFLLLAAVVMVVTAAALPQLQLKPGLPLMRGDNTGALQPEGAPTVLISVSTFFKALVGAIVALILAYAGYQLIKGVGWRDILKSVVFIIMVAVPALVILFAIANIRITVKPLEPEVLPPVLSSESASAPLPGDFIWLAWIGLAVVIVLLVVWFVYWRRKQISVNARLRLEAEQALQALEAGADFKNVIVRCYRQMSLALQRDQGLEREEAMTARDFESLLTTRGFPVVPVQQLTRLFEAARYGLWQTNRTDEQLAVDCLNTIVQHSRERRSSPVV